MKKRGYYIEIELKEGEIQKLDTLDLLVSSWFEGFKFCVETIQAPNKGTIHLYGLVDPDMYITLKPEALFK